MREAILSYIQSKGWRYSFSPDKQWIRLDKCPICSKTSRRPFAIHAAEGTARCHHGECGWSGGLTLLKAHFGELIQSVRAEKFSYAAPSESSTEENRRRFLDQKGVVDRFKAFRLLSDKTVAQFRIGLDDKRGVCYPYFEHSRLINIKYKRRDKAGTKFPSWWTSSKGESARACLYNVDSLRGNETVYLVEGEDDCMMLCQLGLSNVVSIPHGAATTRGAWLDPLESFKDIVVVMDADAAGRRAAPMLAETLGKYRCRTVELPQGFMVPPGPWGKEEFEAKDITDFVRAGKTELLLEVIKNARPPKHDKIAHASEFVDEFLEEFRNGDRSRGATTGFPSVDAVIGGRRPGELTIVTGVTSGGKSTFTFNVAMNVATLGESVLFSAFEHGPKKIIQKASSWITGKTRFVGSSNEMTLSDAEHAAKVMRDMPLYLVDHYGRFEPSYFADCLDYAARRLSVTTSILDHLHFILDPKNPESERLEIDQAMLTLRTATEQSGIFLMVVAHPKQKNGDDNPVHNLADLRGSSFLSQVADNVWVVWRDMDLAKLRPGFGRSIIYVIKNRSECGTIGKIELAFDMNAQKYIDRLGNELDFIPEMDEDMAPVNEEEFR